MDTLVHIVFAVLNLGAQTYPTVEAAGAVYQCEAHEAFTTAPVPGVVDGATVSIRLRVNGCPLVATYHTHPAGTPVFSRQDIAMACQLKVPFYILPKGGEMRVFDCRGMPKYVQRTAHEEPRIARGTVVVL